MGEGKGRVLVLDDDSSQRFVLMKGAGSFGYESEMANNAEDALKKVRFENFDVLVTDLQMPDMNGIEVLKSARLHDPTISVVLITAHGTIETAVEAMKLGAEDYILKPIDMDAFEVVLDKVFEKRHIVKENKRLVSEVQSLRKDLGIRYHLTQSIGQSEKATKLKEEIKRAMKTMESSFILGESGSGRMDVARMIHYNSPWANNTLLDFNTDDFPEEFQETQLFGHEEPHNIPGLVEKAHLGTLIINDIHLLNENSQVRLYKALKEERVQRVGGNQFHPVTFRLLAISNKDAIAKRVVANEFREDLHQLLMTNMIEVPALRERIQDIPILATLMVKRIAGPLGKEIKKIDPMVYKHLSTYDFPGNIRELETFVETAVKRCQSDTLTLKDFNIRISL